MIPEDPPKMQRLLYLDGWRGLAIICVVIGHFIPIADKAGALGVELFFVLSGRLMAQILFYEQMPLGHFFKRRASRIIPALFFFCGIMFGVSIMAYYFHINSGFLVKPLDLISALTFTMNYAVVLLHTNSILVHTWSVSVEEHSYILLALIAVLFRRNPQRAALICLAISILAILNGARLSYMGVGGVHEIYWRTDVRIASSFLSVAVYVAFKNLPPMRSFVAPMALVIGAATMMSQSPLPLLYSLGTGLIAIAVNALDTAPKAILSFFSSKPLRVTGILSYSIYLWQQPFYIALSKIPAAFAFLGLLICGVVSYYCIEQPARRYLNLHWR